CTGGGGRPVAQQPGRPGPGAYRRPPRLPPGQLTPTPKPQKPNSRTKKADPHHVYAVRIRFLGAAVRAPAVGRPRCSGSEGVRVRAGAVARVQRVDGGDVVVGQLEVEDVEVL